MTSSPSANEVRVGGATYTIGDIPVERAPVWKLLKKDGDPLDARAFNALPDADKAALYGQVVRHFVSLDQDWA
jgi:hypothetical protein